MSLPKKIMEWKGVIATALAFIWFSVTYLNTAHVAITAYPKMRYQLDSIIKTPPKDGVFVTKKQFYKALFMAYKTRGVDSMRAVQLEQRVDDLEEINEEMIKQFNNIYQHLRD